MKQTHGRLSKISIAGSLAQSYALNYIKDYYKVPAEIGARIEYSGNDAKGLQLGTIRGADGPYLLILLDGEQESRPYHPTWRIRYLEKEIA